MTAATAPPSRTTVKAAPSWSAAGGPHRNLLTRAVGRLGSAFVQAVLTIIALVWLLPTIGLFVSSLRSVEDNNSAGWWKILTVPSQLTIQNYRKILSNHELTHALLNTVLITVPTTVLLVAVASLAAYSFAWMDFPARDWIFLVVVGLLVVPVQVALIPVAGIYTALGIFGTIPCVILFHIAFGLPFAIFLLRNFFAGIPRDLLEAARMDGASEWRIFVRVIMPLGLPAIASLAIFQFLWVWNDLLVALVFAGPDSIPLTVFLRDQTRQFGSSIDILAPGAFISLLVPLIVFFSFQRFFVQGVLASSVK